MPLGVPLSVSQPPLSDLLADNVPPTTTVVSTPRTQALDLAVHSGPGRRRIGSIQALALLAQRRFDLLDPAERIAALGVLLADEPQVVGTALGFPGFACT